MSINLSITFDRLVAIILEMIFSEELIRLIGQKCKAESEVWDLGKRMIFA